MKTNTLRAKLGELRDSLSDRLGISKKRPSPRKLKTSTRQVHFGPVKVTEFERLLCGGGGVPDGDVVSLGLGAPVRTYETTVRERQRGADKDTYCMRGCLDVRKRAQLLCEWMHKKEYLALLRKIVKPELLQLQRGRTLSNAHMGHMREMPGSLTDAQQQARQDEAAAVAVAAGRVVSPRAKVGDREQAKQQQQQQQLHGKHKHKRAAEAEAEAEEEGEGEGEEAEAEAAGRASAEQSAAKRRGTGAASGAAAERKPKAVLASPRKQRRQAGAEAEAEAEVEAEIEAAAEAEEVAGRAWRSGPERGVAADKGPASPVWAAEAVGQSAAPTGGPRSDKAGGSGPLAELSRWLVWNDF